MTLAERLALPDVSGLPDWQAADALNAPHPDNGSKVVDVATADAREILLATGEWGGIELLARTTPSAEVPAQLVGAAITAVATLTTTHALVTSDPAKYAAVQMLLGALVTAGVVSTGTRDALLALADRPMSWAEANGVVVTARTVGLARGAVG